MRSHEVRFFYDQMFVKEPGTDAPTPWHQDLSFWPVRGEQICSFWIPLDPVNKDNRGLLYVKGSHRWPQRFKAISPDYVSAIIDETMDNVPDINVEPEKYDLLHWDMRPGDILMFHPLTLHGSNGNHSRRVAAAAHWRCAGPATTCATSHLPGASAQLDAGRPAMRCGVPAHPAGCLGAGAQRPPSGRAAGDGQAAGIGVEQHACRGAASVW
jgi:ectoine hydroxylase-related dioxygenase (phytanoyl-CoA dioxygenase family)